MRQPIRRFLSENNSCYLSSLSRKLPTRVHPASAILDEVNFYGEGVHGPKSVQKILIFARDPRRKGRIIINANPIRSASNYLRNYIIFGHGLSLPFVQCLLTIFIFVVCQGPPTPTRDLEHAHVNLK